MFLKYVDFNGFKSFAQSTRLDLSAARYTKESKEHHGMTAVVGPNGSGKSNIADGLRWVMGEQSMKSLRSKKSEDVIFSGSQKRRKMNAAEVSLCFDNNDGSLPIEYSEVVISRKVYRDGSGEYRINDAKVRRLDIIDILAHVSLGKGSYSIVTQGMTDAFLSATPIERRMIIEDAAGVKPFQIKKKRALTKLKTSQMHVERVNTLIAEIIPHLKTLKRQANRAAKAKDVAEKLQGEQEKLYRWRWEIFKNEKESALDERDKHDTSLKKAQQEVDTLANNLKKEISEMEEMLSEDNTDVTNKRREIEVQLAKNRKNIAILEGRVALSRERAQHEINALKSSIPVDTRYVRKQLRKIVDNAKINSDSKEEGIAKEILSKVRSAISTLIEDVKRGIVKVDTTKERESILKRSKKEITTTIREQEKLQKEGLRYEEEIVNLDKALADKVLNQKEQRKKFFQKEQLLRDKEHALTAMRDALNECKIRIARVEVREEDLTNTIQNNLRITPKTLCERVVYTVVDDGAILEQRVDRLKMQHELIGAIDPLIIQEYKETQERYDFLNDEVKDLIKAIKDLDEVVKEMDKEINVAFKEAFSFINKEFRSYFRMLFGGGKATLHKEEIVIKNTKQSNDDSEDNENSEYDADNLESDDEKTQAITEIGITITVTPPGKTVKRLEMLSGGERSLVSLALLFAVIAFSPPPFVVLDEVEAALDEANARRFSNILDNFSAETQLVVITHNRETMRHANILYGVTMNDDGMSRLLSVELDSINTKE